MLCKSGAPIIQEEIADHGVSITNVPSYRKAAAAAIGVQGIGRVTGDVAWGGNWFFLIENHGQKLELSNVEKLSEYAWHVRQAVNAQGETITLKTEHGESMELQAHAAMLAGLQVGDAVEVKMVGTRATEIRKKE